MPTFTTRPGDLAAPPDRSDGPVESTHSSVSWGAIAGGALAAVSLSIVLMILGSGLGLGLASPWAHAGPSATAITAMAAIWLIVAQWLACGFGGYLTGRLRTRWVGIHDHEVFFRDTANGFLTWALGNVGGAAVLTVLATMLASGAMQGVGRAAQGALAGAAATAGGALSAPAVQGMDYVIDEMFRPGPADSAEPSELSADVRAETRRILVRGIAQPDTLSANRPYLSRLIASHTGLSQAGADSRVASALAAVQEAEAAALQAADKARRAASSFSMLSALGMLLGAFIAAAGAALGGAHRDEWQRRLARRTDAVPSTAMPDYGALARE